MLGAYDAKLALRGGGFGALGAALTLLVVAATDAGDPWSRRAGMTAALAPVCGALGAFAAARIADNRGESRALAAVGVAPSRVHLGAVLGAAVVGLAGALAIALGVVDVAVLFPRAAAPHHWVATAHDAHELASGLWLRTDGRIELVAPGVATVDEAAPDSLVAALGLGVAAAVAPLWVVLERSAARTACVALGALLTTIGAFQGVAAGRASSAWLLVGPAALALDAALSIARERRALDAPPADAPAVV